jgi:uncharacterized integral membrane protein (TIGR00698 family)
MSQVATRTEVTRPVEIRLGLLKNEDWLALGFGILLIAAVLLGLPLAAASYRWAGAEEFTGRVLSLGNLGNVTRTGILVTLVGAAGLFLMRGSPGGYLLGLPVIYLLACAAQAVAGNTGVNYWGLEYVLFALLLGLLIGNLFRVPSWLQEAVRTEFFVKIGLVLLGTDILFQTILGAGMLGIVQALLVVTVVWFFAFWLAKRLRVDDEFATMLSSAVAICGVSAAIAACGVIQGDRKKLSYVTSLVLIVAVPMMVLMPWLVKWSGMPDAAGGAWLGGTLDTTGSVLAAGAQVSEQAEKVGAVVKLSQNILIGVAAFLLAAWWALRKSTVPAERPSLRVIWERFPKFVLGLVAASLIFSFVLDRTLTTQAKPALKGLQITWFAMAFVCIGLETRLGDLFKMEQGRPALAFLGAQLFNIFWTLLLALLLFGGIFFTVPVAR